MNIIDYAEIKKAEETILRARELIDRRSGIIACITEADYTRKMPHYFCYFAQMSQGLRRDGNSVPLGSGIFREQAIASAIGEAIERYCSRSYDKRMFITSAYKNLNEPALNPKEIALYSNIQYNSAKFPHRPFKEDTIINWVRGYSLIKRNFVLVPACMVYLSYYSDGEPSIWQQSSTGLCCGLNIKEAMLGGLCEVIERDAFMIMWANKLSMPRIMWNNDKIRIERKDIFFEVNFINITSDIGIPTILSVLVNPKKKKPMVSVGASSNLNPIKAMEKALLESLCLPCGVTGDAEKFNVKWKDRFRILKGFRYHAILYALPCAFSHIEFAINSQKTIKENELPNLSKNNTEEDFQAAISLLSELGYDVIVVNITTSDIEQAGFVVMRVIVPGAIPLNWGMPVLCHKKGERLYKVPRRLGYRQVDTLEREINNDPHPFP